MLDKFKGLGWKKYYLIFGMCDETFSVNYTSEIPEDVDRGWFYFFVTLLNQFYWVASATIGGIIGSLLKFDTSGISFVMTAMFVVIFLDHCRNHKGIRSEEDQTYKRNQDSNHRRNMDFFFHLPIFHEYVDFRRITGICLC